MWVVGVECSVRLQGLQCGSRGTRPDPRSREKRERPVEYTFKLSRVSPIITRGRSMRLEKIGLFRMWSHRRSTQGPAAVGQGIFAQSLRRVAAWRPPAMGAGGSRLCAGARVRLRVTGT